MSASEYALHNLIWFLNIFTEQNVFSIFQYHQTLSSLIASFYVYDLSVGTN